MLNTISPKFDPLSLDGYPHAGERIGPAWRALLAATARGDWIEQITALVAMEAAGPIARKTAANLISAGTRHGFLQRQHIRGTSNPHKYRIRRNPNWVRTPDRPDRGGR